MAERNTDEKMKPEAEEARKMAIVPSSQSVERWYRVKVGKYPPSKGKKMHGKILTLRGCRPPLEATRPYTPSEPRIHKVVPKLAVF